MAVGSIEKTSTSKDTTTKFVPQTALGMEISKEEKTSGNMTRMLISVIRNTTDSSANKCNGEGKGIARGIGPSGCANTGGSWEGAKTGGPSSSSSEE